jgi:hypothetical protein
VILNVEFSPGKILAFFLMSIRRSEISRVRAFCSSLAARTPIERSTLARWQKLCQEVRTKEGH